MSYRELSSKLVKTQKSRKCAWCAEQIEKGSHAINRSYTYEGEFGYDYMHSECSDAARRMGSQIDGEFDWQPGDFARGKTHA